ncbi:hypothetical protein JHK86_033953 [Glycine max]|nr:hypothetical protein JHK86_033953 [Glycine max]
MAFREPSSKLKAFYDIAFKDGLKPSLYVTKNCRGMGFLLPIKREGTLTGSRKKEKSNAEEKWIGNTCHAYMHFASQCAWVTKGFRLLTIPFVIFVPLHGSQLWVPLHSSPFFSMIVALFPKDVNVDEKLPLHKLHDQVVFVIEETFGVAKSGINHLGFWHHQNCLRMLTNNDHALSRAFLSQAQLVAASAELSELHSLSSQHLKPLKPWKGTTLLSAFHGWKPLSCISVCLEW